MGVDTIIAKIQADKEQQIEHIRREARAEAEQILTRAAEQAEHDYEAIVAEGQREIEAHKNRILAQASMDAHRKIREEREKGIALCFSEAEKMLNQLMQTPSYAKILKNLILSGIRELGSDEVVIISTEHDRALIHAILSELPTDLPSITTSPECALTTGGVILKSKSGKFMVNNTFEARVERYKDDLVYSIAQILFKSE